MAEAVAANMLGADTPYLPKPWFWSDQYDLSLQFAGHNAGHDQVVTRGTVESGSWSAFYFRGGRFVDTVVLEYLNPAWVKTLGDPNDTELVRVGSGEKRPVSASVPLDGNPPKNAIMVGERVYLRPFTKADAEQFSIWSRREPQSDALFNVGRFPMGKLGKWHGVEEEQKKAYPEWIRFAVVDRATGELVGGNGLLEMDYHNRFGETESFFLPPYRNQGYGSEGKHLVLDYAFNRLDLHMVVSWVYFPNTRSAAALRCAGRQWPRVLRRP